MTHAAESLCAHEAVSDILSEIEQRIGPQRFNAWFKHGVKLTVDAGRVEVAVPNPFVGSWIETHYQALIAESAEALNGQPHTVAVMVDPQLSGQVCKRQLDQQASQVEMVHSGRSRPRQPVQPVAARHQLSDFVVGESNRLAYTAALAMVGPAPAPFNPLFVYGSCGVGKTHLLQGIHQAASRAAVGGRPQVCRYVTAEQFTNEFIISVRQRKFAEFRQRYRELDLLVIDDVHFLSAKKATQDEFLHTFDSIATAGRRVVMASDAHPRMVADLNESLVSRFAAGMVVKIDPPDGATRLEILRRRAAKMNLDASGDVLEYIAMHVRGSARELEGTLIKLSALSALEGGQVTLSLAASALADHLARTGSAITLGDIEAVVAAFFGITPADIHSSRRTRTVSLGRMIAMFLARRHTRMSYPEIGRFMGKNHSSAVLAVQKLEGLLAADEEVCWMTPAGPKSMPAKRLLELLAGQIA